MQRFPSIKTKKNLSKDRSQRRYSLSVESLENRRLLFGEADIKITYGEWTPFGEANVIQLTPTDASYKPTVLNLTINNVIQAPISKFIQPLGTTYWAAAFPAISSVILPGDKIDNYQSAAFEKIDVGVTFNNSQTGLKTLYYQFGGADYSSPIILPQVDWSASAPSGVTTIRARTNEQTAALVIGQATTSLTVENWNRYSLHAGSTFTVTANKSGIVDAKIIGSGASSTLQLTGKKAGQVALTITDTDDASASPRYIGVTVKNPNGSIPMKPNYVAIGAVDETGVNDVAFFRGTIEGDPTKGSVKQYDYQYVYLNNGPNQIPKSAVNEPSGAVYVSGTLEPAGYMVVNAAGRVTDVKLQGTLKGYTSPPAVTFPAPPPGGTQATGTAVIVNGTLTGISVTNPSDNSYPLISNGPEWAPQSWRLGNQSYDGKKLGQLLRESWKTGSTPTVVYYNMMTNGESPAIALSNIRNEAFIRGYFEDLRFALNTVRQAANGAPVAMIIEPDMLAYFMASVYTAQSPSDPTYSGIGTWADPSTIKLGYDVEAVAKAAGLIPATSTLVGNSLDTFVKAINEGIRYWPARTPPVPDNLQFGWKFNTWAVDFAMPNKAGWNKGVSKVTDWFIQNKASLQTYYQPNGQKYAACVTDSQAFIQGQIFVRAIGQQAGTWYQKAGICTNSMDFVTMDKYGIDGGNDKLPNTEPGYRDPEASKWFFSSDHWNNYLAYASSIRLNLTPATLPIRLWQIPIGHVNGSQAVKPSTDSTGSLFQNLANQMVDGEISPGDTKLVGAWEDSATSYFLGDKFTGLTAERPSGNKFFQDGNAAADPVILPPDRSGTIAWGSHIASARDIGVEAILFGPGLIEATIGGGYTNVLAVDDYFWACATQQYYANGPVAISTDLLPGARQVRITGDTVRQRPVSPTGYARSAVFEVTRLGDASTAITYGYHAVSVGLQPAIPGKDYLDSHKDLKFAAGQRSAFAIVLINVPSPYPTSALTFMVKVVDKNQTLVVQAVGTLVQPSVSSLIQATALLKTTLASSIPPSSAISQTNLVKTQTKTARSASTSVARKAPATSPAVISQAARSASFSLSIGGKAISRR